MLKNFLQMIMKYILSLITCSLIFSFAMHAQQKQTPVRIIFDSDMGPDYDDVGAITLLHAFADKGEAKILATVASTKYNGVAAVLNVFNTFFNKPGIPIGVPKGQALELRDGQHWTDSLIANYPHEIKSNDDVPDVLEVYRKILAAQPDHSVTIVTVGFLTNVSNLLQTPPDKYSKLEGSALVKRKVKQLVCMAGRFPSGSEFNVNRDVRASQNTFTNWPTPVLFSGFEIGQKIKTGLPLIHNSAVHGPTKDVFRICIAMSEEDKDGRMSWDETAVLVAVKGYMPWYTIQPGKITVADDGSNNWIVKESNQAKLQEAKPPLEVQALINELMMHQPVKKKGL
jgi:inosine-uridine nucleoside N-ribohydrolase